jgi:hypothetical protein
VAGDEIGADDVTGPVRAEVHVVHPSPGYRVVRYLPVLYSAPARPRRP